MAGEAKRRRLAVVDAAASGEPVVLELSAASAAQLLGSFQAWKLAEAQFQRELGIYLAARGVDTNEQISVNFDGAARRIVVSRPVPGGG